MGSYQPSMGPLIKSYYLYKILNTLFSDHESKIHANKLNWFTRNHLSSKIKEGYNKKDFSYLIYDKNVDTTELVLILDEAKILEKDKAAISAFFTRMFNQCVNKTQLTQLIPESVLPTALSTFNSSEDGHSDEFVMAFKEKEARYYNLVEARLIHNLILT